MPRLNAARVDIVIEAGEVIRRIEWLALEGNLTAEEAVEEIASLATSYRLARNSDDGSSHADDRASFAAPVSQPQVGDTITRIVVSECVYRWEVDEYGMGDWYPEGQKIVYEHPKWKDVPGVE